MELHKPEQSLETDAWIMHMDRHRCALNQQLSVPEHESGAASMLGVRVTEKRIRLPKLRRDTGQAPQTCPSHKDAAATADGSNGSGQHTADLTWRTWCPVSPTSIRYNSTLPKPPA